MWQADLDPETVLVHYWANLDSLSDGDVEQYTPSPFRRNQPEPLANR